MSLDVAALAVGAGAAVACGAAGLLTTALVGRLPEPEPDAVLAAAETEVETATVEGREPDLTRLQRDRLTEGPKRLYADLAAEPRFRLAVVLAAAVAGALLGWRVGPSWLLPLLLPLSPIGASLAVVDLRTRLLPARIVIPTTLGVLAYGVVAVPFLGYPDALVRGLVGLAIAYVVYWVLWFISPRGMGYGDVRLAAPLGFTLAYLGWAEWLVGMYLPFLTFALPGLVLAIVHRDRAMLRRAFPFGPFMLAGAVLGVLVGYPLVDALFLP